MGCRPARMDWKLALVRDDPSMAKVEMGWDFGVLTGAWSFIFHALNLDQTKRRRMFNLYS
jgi:hypothetical protein